MKILRLDLVAFGHFTDHSLDLAGGRQGLHVIYGPNEAGKTTALRALRELFYGINVRSADNFVHPHPNMRIGAVLQRKGGETLHCIRRKGLRHTLLAADDETILDENTISQFLGGIDEDTFRLRYGIDYEALVRGGRAIAQGKGDLGESLFAAGAGVANLRDVEARLDDEAGKLFKPSGKIPDINKRLAELKERKSAIKQCRLPTAEWKKHDKALRDAQAQHQQLTAKWLEKSSEKERLARIAEAVPLLQRSRQLEEELAPLAEVPLLDDDFGERRVSVDSKLRQAAIAAEEAQQQIAEITAKRDEFDIPLDLLQHDRGISARFKELGAVLQAADDAPALELERRQLERRLDELLRQAGRADADRRRLDELQRASAEVVRIQNLANQRQALVDSVETASRRLAELRRRRAQLEDELAALQVAGDPAPLRLAVQAARHEGPIDRELQQAEAELQQLQSDAQQQLAALPLFSGELDVVEQLAVPTVETCDQFAEELAAAESSLGDIQSGVAQRETEIDQLTQRIDEIRLEQDVPSEDDLQRARQVRGQGWELVRRAWLEGESGTAEQSRFVELYETAVNLPDAFQQSMADADETVDRLRREADRVGEKARLVSQRTRAEKELERLAATLTTAAARLEELQARWHAAWEPSGIEPCSPREMYGWHRQHAALVVCCRSLREARGAHQDLQQRRDACVKQCVVALGDDQLAADSSLHAVLQCAENLLETAESQIAARRELQRDIRNLSSEIDETTQASAAAAEKYSAWQAGWAEAMQPLGLPTDAAPPEANALLHVIEELLDVARQIESLDDRLQGIRARADRFETAVGELAQAVATDLIGQSAERIITQLNMRLEEARKNQALSAEHEERLASERQRLRRSESKVKEMQAALDQLCREAGCEAADDLGKIERMSKQRQSREQQHRQLQQQLHGLSANCPLNELISAAESHDPDQIPASIAKLEDEIDQLQRQRDEISRQIGAAGNELNKMDGGARAAEAAEEAETLLAEIAASARHYVRLRTASAVLKSAIEQYRQRHEAPLLARAGDLFAKLTLGSFSGLRAEYGEQSLPQLVGVRPGGKTVGVAGMSEGTCDQLYLALRLASLRHDLVRREPVPFVADDVMIMFDDQRCAATLEVLAELSRQTQVILFTHHDHLVDLSRQTVDADTLFIHQLDGRPAAADDGSGQPQKDRALLQP